MNDLILYCLLRSAMSINVSNYFEGALQLPFESINKNHFIVLPDTYSFGTVPITCHSWNKNRSRKFFLAHLLISSRVDTLIDVTLFEHQL